MSLKFQVSSFKRFAAAMTLFVVGAVAWADPLTSLCSDRAAIERVYHAHRTGTKPPFEEALPQPQLASLVRRDLKEQSMLAKVYGIEVTPAMVAAEVERINASTRAPGMLAEIKAALNNDPERFARAYAKPIVVERLLRQKFDNDDALHAPQRAEAEAARTRLLAGQTVADLRDLTWQLTARPAAEASPPPAVSPPGKGKGTSTSYTNEATAQLAQVLSSPRNTAEGEPKVYFEDLHPELRQVLQVQLREPGDVSAVIEMPRGFLVFVARERSAEILRAASLSIPKRSYDERLKQQTLDPQRKKSP